MVHPHGKAPSGIRAAAPLLAGEDAAQFDQVRPSAGVGRLDEVAAAGYRVINVDATVICERPKLRPHVDAIRASLASLLRVGASCVSVKGKTNEGMDATGAGVGMAVHCAALLEETQGAK